MKQKKIIVLETVHIKQTIAPDIRTITIGDLGDWVRSREIFSHLFRYKEVAFHVSDYRRIIRPFLCFLTLKIICRGQCYILETNGKRHAISLFLLLTQCLEFFKEAIQIPFCLFRHTKTIKRLYEAPAVKAPSTNLSLPPLYLRTDRASGVSAGGAMGHTIGVINSLEHFTPKPTLIATVRVPSLDPEIKYHEIKLEQRFRNFYDILLLESTHLVSGEAFSRFRDTSFSFVYQRYSTYNYSGVLVARKLKIPFVLEFNSPANWTSTHWAKGLGYKGMADDVESLNVKRADVVVVVSEPLREILVHRGVNPGKILVNPNGVDPERYSPNIEGAKIKKQFDLKNKTVIGFIGTFGKWHGVEVLARAYGLLIKAYPDYRKTTQLLMIGDGVTMPQVKKEIEYFNTADNVTLTGIVPQEEGPAHLAACDLLVSPHVPNPDGTPFFGSPTKLFEYMAMAKGIIASDLDQVGDILEHDHTAWMVKPGDAESLMGGLKTMIDNPETGKRLGEVARQEVIAKYTWKEHTRKIIEKLKERCPCE